MLDDLQGIGALLTVFHKKLDEQHLSHHGVGGGVFIAVNDVDEFTHLLDNLLQTFGGTLEADGHPAEVRIATLGDHQGFDVVTSPGEDLADSHEDSGLVVDEDGESMDDCAGIRSPRSIGSGGSSGHDLRWVWISLIILTNY